MRHPLTKACGKRGPSLCFAVAMGMLALAAASPAPACSVPVFRYAMERWPADAYGIFVFHRGSMSQADRDVVKWLQAAANSEKSFANCVVETIDVAGPLDPEVKAMWESQKSAKPPWMLVLYPRGSRGTMGIAWSGPLNAQAAAKVLDSPKRREVARRLLAGDCAVWVLLENSRPDAGGKSAGGT